jgi:hypothetical protein
MATDNKANQNPISMLDLVSDRFQDGMEADDDSYDRIVVLLLINQIPTKPGTKF